MSSDRIEVGPVDKFGQGAHKVVLGKRQICLVRIDEDWYAIGDKCSHQDVSLSEGDLDAPDCSIECPKHGASFSLESGMPLALPPTQPVATYSVVIEDSQIYLEVK